MHRLHPDFAESLFRASQHDVFRVAYSLMRNKADAEDIGVVVGAELELFDETGGESSEIFVAERAA